MKHERCPYCNQPFHDEGAFERHLAGPQGRCMTVPEMRACGFIQEARGWYLDVPMQKKQRRIKRPPDLLI